MGGGKRKVPPAKLPPCEAPRMTVQGRFKPMPADYDRSMEARQNIPSSARGHKGDEDSAVGDNVGRGDDKVADTAGAGADARADASSGGAAGPPILGIDSASPYMAGANYMAGPSALHVGGYAAPQAPPPSQPRLMEEQNELPCVAPRFGGKNYSTSSALGLNGYHASSLPAGIVHAAEFSQISARLPPSTTPSAFDGAPSLVHSGGFAPWPAGAALSVVDRGTQPGPGTLGSRALPPSSQLHGPSQLPPWLPSQQSPSAQPGLLQPASTFSSRAGEAMYALTAWRQRTRTRIFLPAWKRSRPWFAAVSPRHASQRRRGPRLSQRPQRAWLRGRLQHRGHAFGRRFWSHRRLRRRRLRRRHHAKLRMQWQGRQRRRGRLRL
eukprot:TRINITY_DN4196_c0_g1_i2.p1 TRINITY_DN4196_c0_g1~~TRINITY_DN4196_c0_g1_i2.p1  ORF type:complete len:381 (+),score=27.27 TRINITY_DN4196_c0_g1_i2:728-1870(+)